MQNLTNLQFRFRPIRFAWAAIHPKPIGTVYFIGGAFFGSFPTLFYRFLLKRLFLKGYTVVALPFRFSFRHWAVTLGLVENQDEIRRELAEEASKQGFETAIYMAEPGKNIPEVRDYWVGHSLGCKYIALMELLTDFEVSKRRDSLPYCLKPEQIQRIDKLIDQSPLETISLYNQPSVLIDPVIADLDNAVPIRSLQLLVSRFIKVLPSRGETFCLIKKSSLFALTSIISLNSQVAHDSIVELRQILAQRLLDFQTLSVENSWLGKHLAVLGIGCGNQLIVETVIDKLRRSQMRLDVRVPIAIDKSYVQHSAPNI